MKLDLSLVTFSLRGSYLAACALEDYSPGANTTGLFLKTLRGAARDMLICRLAVLWEGEPVPFTYEARPSELVLSTEKGDVRICFASEKDLLFKGTGMGIGLRLEETRLRYAHEVRHAGKAHHMLVSPPNSCRYLADAQEGSISITQDWNGRNAGEVTVDFSGEGGFLCSLEEVDVEWEPKPYAFDYDHCRRRAAEAFNAFCRSMPQAPRKYDETRELAAYVCWSSIVKASGCFKREAMLMSKNRMAALWSWDHCFNALALARGDPQAAWDQFMLPFDYQDASGRVPDRMTDAGQSSLYCKPPIHGWALARMMEHITLSPAQAGEAYETLSRLTDWWLRYRDGDGDGICEYWHGNDSGWDNATAFAALPPLETPDLAAFLVIQMDVLADLSHRLGAVHDAARWKRRADAMLSAMAEHCYVDHAPVARRGGTHEIIPNDSLLMYVPVVLGARMPRALLRRTVETLKSEKFLTAHGLATEAPRSALYQPDGYWRGPIWAPSTLLIVDGLARCGEAAFAREIARRFCAMVAQSGCAENFDALTGAGLCDRAYTWTASVFLLLAQELARD